MTTYVTEYSGIGFSNQAQGVMVALSPKVASQTVAVGSNSAPFNAATRFIRVHTDAIISFNIDVGATATTADARMAANQTEYFCVVPGMRIATVANT